MKPKNRRGNRQMRDYLAKAKIEIEKCIAQESNRNVQRVLQAQLGILTALQRQYAALSRKLDSIIENSKPRPKEKVGRPSKKQLPPQPKEASEPFRREELIELQRKVGLNNSRFARLLGVHDPTLIGWLKKRVPRPKNVQKIRELNGMADEQLQELVKPYTARRLPLPLSEAHDSK